MRKKSALLFPTILIIIFGGFYIISGQKDNDAHSINEDINRVVITNQERHLYSGALSLKTIKNGDIVIPFQIEGIKTDNNYLFYLDNIKDDYSATIENYFEKEGLNFSLIETQEDYEDFLSVDEFAFLFDLNECLSNLEGNWIEFSSSDKELFDEFFSLKLDSDDVIENNANSPDEYYSFKDSLKAILTNQDSDVNLIEG